MKQAQSVEIAYLIGGEVVSVRRLSRRGEWRAGAAAFGPAPLWRRWRGRWSRSRWSRRTGWSTGRRSWGCGCSSVSARRRWRRRGRWTGRASTASAPASTTTPSRRCRSRSSGGRAPAIGSGWRPGSPGDCGGSARRSPSRASLGKRPTDLVLAAERTRGAALGAATFVVVERAGHGTGAGASERRRPTSRAPRAAAARAGGARQRALRGAGRGPDRGGGHEVGHPDPRDALGDREAAARGGADAGARAAPVLRRPADLLPAAGLRGRGVSLSREGEIRSHWIARSTYGADCPVNQCLSDVVSTWFFEPLPESMKVILPVQVLRTDKPLPYGPARAAADLEAETARRRCREEATGAHRDQLTDGADAHRRAGDRAAGGEPRLPVRVLAVGDRAQRRGGGGGGARGGVRRRAARRGRAREPLFGRRESTSATGSRSGARARKRCWSCSRACGPSTASSRCCELGAPATRARDGGAVVGDGTRLPGGVPAELRGEDRPGARRRAEPLVAGVAIEGNAPAEARPRPRARAPRARRGRPRPIGTGDRDRCDGPARAPAAQGAQTSAAREP